MANRITVRKAHGKWGHTKGAAVADAAWTHESPRPGPSQGSSGILRRQGEG
ncbi:MAG: hypothetical protein GDA52_01720 [Rhodobacteraceae bacterium]|nr:hypothetical protein [Paracoccaceae bacterium]